MAAMDTERSTRVSRVVAAPSRRALVAAGAGWVLGVAGLLLPESMDEAAARSALGGAKGGRHGKDQRGRNKQRGNGKSEPGDDKAKDERDSNQAYKFSHIWFSNHTSSDASLIQGQDTYTLPPTSSVRLSSQPPYISIAATLIANDHNFTVDAGNDAITEPRVYIYDNSAGEIVFDEYFDEGELIDSGLFRVQRSADTADYKELSIGVYNF